MKKSRKLTIWYNNINGYKSKADSCMEIISKLNPDIIVMNETKLAKRNTLHRDLQNYDLVTKYVKKGKGGILCGIKKNIGITSILEVTSSSNDNILTVKISINNFSLRLVVAYGPQENEPSDRKEEFFKDLEIEVKSCKVNDDNMIMIGDLNSKIDVQECKIIPLSNNGKFLEEIISRSDLKVMNFSEKCEGKWTHVVRTTGKKSVLDYIIVNKELDNDIKEVLVDEELLYTPFRLIGRNQIEVKYSDHNTITMRLELQIEKRDKSADDRKRKSSWKFSEEGWKNYYKITSENPPDSGPSGDVSKEYTKVEEYITQAMKYSFKKPKKKKNISPGSLKEESKVYKILRKRMKLGKVQRKVASLYIDKLKENQKKTVNAKYAQKVKNTLLNLSQNDKLSHSAFWKLRKSLNLKSEVGTSIMLKSGVEVYGKNAITAAYRDEFEHRLRNRTIDNHLKEYETKTNLLCNLYVEEGRSNHNVLNVEPSHIQKIIKSLSKNKAPGPDGLPAEIFINAGQELVIAIASLFNSIRIAGKVPDQWNKVNIKTLYKNKGSHKDLENYRGVFLTQTFSKLYEKYLMSESETEVTHISLYQAGSRPNRSAADQLYLIRACIDHAKYMKKIIIFTLYDFTQCFDGMWLEDSLISLKNIGVREEIISSIKALNEKAEIVVKTAVGNTEEFKVHNIVKQGTVIGPLLCSASTAECCVEHGAGGANIGETNLKSLAYVDDIVDINETTEDAEGAHDVVLKFTAKKRLELSGKKCSIIAMNAKPNQIPKLTIKGKLVKREKSAKYLGDILNGNGTNDDLIDDRVKKGNGSMVNIFSMIQDVTLGNYTIETTILLYTSIYLSSVLYNSQSWSCLKRKDINKLQGNQLSFLKRLLHSPKCTSTAIVLCETGILPMEYEIYSRKLVFLQHILKLDETDPVKIVYYEQLKYEYEVNWANEVRDIRKIIKIEVEDERIIEMSKTSWKAKVKESIRRAALEKLNIDCQKLRKGKRQYNELKTKEYLVKLQTDEARIVFAFRSGTLNIKTQRPYNYNNKDCRVCGEAEETIQHVVNQCRAVQNCDELDIDSEDTEILSSVAKRIKTFLCED